MLGDAACREKKWTWVWAFSSKESWSLGGSHCRETRKLCEYDGDFNFIPNKKHKNKLDLFLTKHTGASRGFPIFKISLWNNQLGKDSQPPIGKIPIGSHPSPQDHHGIHVGSWWPGMLETLEVPLKDGFTLNQAKVELVEDYIQDIESMYVSRGICTKSLFVYVLHLIPTTD